MKAQIFVVSILVILVGAAASVLAAEKIRLSVTNANVSFLPAGVALKRGFFKDEGFDVEVIRMNVPNAITALVTGDVAYTLIFGSVVRGALRGLPMRVVASFLDSSTHALIARADYKSIRDLKGKTVGFGNFGGTDDVAGRFMLRHGGIDPEKEVKMIALGPDRARLAGLKEGLVDAVVVAPPADALGREMGFQLVMRAYEAFRLPFIGLGTNLKQLKDKPDEVKKVLRALIRANRFIRENKEGAVQVLSEWARVERSHAAAAYDGAVQVFSRDGTIPEDGLRLVIEQAKGDLKISRDISFTEVADLGPLREAQRELGIKQR
jgi:NitT/TauT family transport system substrate-binding protein